jgi:predicted dehydrogenase
MESFLRLLADGKLDLAALVSHRFPVENAVAAYDLITGKQQQPYLGVLIEYEQAHSEATPRLELVSRAGHTSEQANVRVGVLGAGGFAKGVLIPALKRTSGTQLIGLCASSGARAHTPARKFGFEFCTTDEEDIYSNPSINTVVIATRHHLHAGQVIRALEAGKNVFCEKPLCLTEGELQNIQSKYARARRGLNLMVGFNRRFAPMAVRMKAFLGQAGGPFSMHYRVNAGSLPADHWLLDPEQGGGRILGEACHFVDLLSFLSGAVPVAVQARRLTAAGSEDIVSSIEFNDGSLGTISYISRGDRAFSKERVEVFGGGCVAVLDDFRSLDLVRHGKRKSFRSWMRQDKGHAAEWHAFADCIQSGSPSPISFDEIVSSTLATIRILDSLRSGQLTRVTFEVPTNVRAPLVS